MRPLPFPPERQKVFDVENADDVLRPAFVNRQPRKLVLRHGREHVIQGRLHGNGDDVVSRHHDLSCGVIREIKEMLYG